jgi:hypothetical protein
MAEAEAQQNNMLKEKCVVLEYKISHTNAFSDFSNYGFFPTFQHLVD